MHISVDAVNVMAAYQPVVLTCVHCGGRIETHIENARCKYKKINFQSYLIIFKSYEGTLDVVLSRS